MRKTFFALLCALVLVSQPAWAQQAVPPVGYKDPGIATLVSAVVPGGGQLYSGDTRKGAMLLGIAVGAPTVAFALAMSSPKVSAAPLLLGSVASMGSWVYGIIDAGDSARRMNAKHGLAGIVPANVTPLVAPDASGGGRVGVNVRF